MTIQEALVELQRVSTDISEAAVLDGNGVAVASTRPMTDDAVAGAAQHVWRAAQRAASEAGARVLHQLVVEAGQGASVMVAEAGHRIAAVTGRRPVLGLVLFDLRTCLSDAFGRQEIL
ncbi:MAG: roadblock/LC7 domain-containing protein [Thermoleophilia bacterium]